MEPASGQTRVDSTHLYQHQFFPGGGVKQSSKGGGNRSLSAERTSSPQNGEHQSSQRDEWHSKSWDWNGAAFTAQRAATGGAECSEGDGSRRQSSTHRQDNGVDYSRKDSSQIVGLKLDGGRVSGTPEVTDHEVIHIDEDDGGGEPRSRNLFGRETSSPPSNETNPYTRGDASPEDDCPLSLNLGGNLYAYREENGKRCRSSSPQSQLPTCQVDDCDADLRKAKDYHRRHKVCVAHSKATKAMVSETMQRFCQQCSRFHPLDQFDEGKRSCRRRLAGHNKRRRKTQPEAAAARSFLIGEAEGGKNSDLLNMLTILSHLQQGPVERVNSVPSEQDILLQCLRQAGSVPSSLDVLRPASGWNHLARNPSEHMIPRTESMHSGLQANDHSSVPTSSSPEAYSILLQNSLKEAARITQENLASLVREQPGGGPGPLAFALTGAADASTNQPGPSQRSVSMSGRIAGPTIDPVQLLSNVAITLQQSIAQAACQTNQSLAIGHAVPQPVVNPQKVPQASRLSTAGRDVAANGRLDRNEEEDASVSSRGGERQGPPSQNVGTNLNNRVTPSEAQSPMCRPSIDLQQPPLQDLSDTSPSGSGSDQQSLGSSHTDREKRNSRISIKLFDKHPGQFPKTLRDQIEEWLAQRPLEMESFIRPGCIILTVFLSLPESDWIKLVSDLPGSLKRLLNAAGGDFWCTGRVLVQVERHSVLVVDGEIIESKLSDPLSTPFIQSVRPLAMVAGQKINVVVKGLNFLKSGTRLLCAFRGKYIAEELCEQYETDNHSEVSGDDSDEEEDVASKEDGAIRPVDDWSIRTPDGDQPLSTSLSEETQVQIEIDGSFFMPETLASNAGRCFIEVTKDTLEGNWKPIIVADGQVCAEIRTLEDEIEAVATIAGKAVEQKGFQRSVVLYYTELARLMKEEEVTQFLHELGWFFQRSFFQHLNGPSQIAQVSPTRLNQLLVYAVEHDWCAVVRKLLDIAFESPDIDAACAELSAVLREEVSLLHRAVRKKCRPMVELLLAYVPSILAGIKDADMASFKQKLEFKLKWSAIFKPDMWGPAGMTPLHVAASIHDAEEVVDALTSDPCQEYCMAMFPEVSDLADVVAIVKYLVEEVVECDGEIFENVVRYAIRTRVLPLVGLHAWLIKKADSGETPLTCAQKGGNIKSLQLVRAKLLRLENPDSTSFNIPELLWDQNLKGDSIVQPELPIWRTASREVIGSKASVSRTCRSNDFVQLPRHVAGIKGVIFKPFLLSIMTIGCICVCLCLVFKDPPHVDTDSLFTWEGLKRGYE